jgi:hypothetical protein
MKAKKPSWLKKPKKATKKDIAKAKSQAKRMGKRIRRKQVQL